MKNKLEKFQVEELKQRFETGRWIDSVRAGGVYESSDGKWRAEANFTWELNQKLTFGKTSYELGATSTKFFS